MTEEKVELAEEKIELAEKKVELKEEKKAIAVDPEELVHEETGKVMAEVAKQNIISKENGITNVKLPGTRKQRRMLAKAMKLPWKNTKRYSKKEAEEIRAVLDVNFQKGEIAKIKAIKARKKEALKQIASEDNSNEVSAEA